LGRVARSSLIVGGVLILAFVMVSMRIFESYIIDMYYYVEDQELLLEFLVHTLLQA